MKKEDIFLLKQLVRSLEDSEIKLAQSHRERDVELFNKIKKSMIQLQKQIIDIAK
jgi:hypothetical protein